MIEWFEILTEIIKIALLLLILIKLRKADGHLRRIRDTTNNTYWWVRQDDT